MQNAVLHVITACVRTQTEAEEAVRALRHAAPVREDEARTLLLFCDLPNADAPKMPEDDLLIRTLQSGVMSMTKISSRRFYLLIRSRLWHDALRLYAGGSQIESPRQVIADLLAHGKTQTRFEAATFAPASLKGRYAFVLFSDLTLSCTPDVPARMLRALSASQHGCVCAAVLPRREYPHSALSRLCQVHPCVFSLSPIHAAQLDALRAHNLSLDDTPTLCTLDALLSAVSPLSAAPVAPGCVFVRRHATTLGDCFAAYRRRILLARSVRSALPDALPPLQLVLLFLSGFTGSAFLAALALLPECYALLRPRMLPGALLRIALLPLTALVALDALSARVSARKRLLLRVPDGLITPLGSMLHGAVLLSLAIYSARALVPILPLSLLWLSAPLLVPALDAPTLERIPLSPDQQSQLRSAAESAFFDAYAAVHSSSPLSMLAACAGCMLGLLEPDEAARRVQTLLSSAAEASDALSAAETASLLVCAQYLRERMGDCDAALRPLPAQIEQIALHAALPKENSALAAFLRAARRQASANETPSSILPHQSPSLDALFLPLGPSRTTAQHPLTLPLTHPHTYLHRAQLVSDPPNAQPAPLERFLALSAAALSHPFYPLLMRSPVCAPYMPLLCI